MVFSPSGQDAGSAARISAMEAALAKGGAAAVVESSGAMSPGGSSVSGDPTDETEAPARRRTRRGKRISMILQQPEEAADAEQALLDAASGQHDAKPTLPGQEAAKAVDGGALGSEG